MLFLSLSFVLTVVFVLNSRKSNIFSTIRTQSVRSLTDLRCLTQCQYFCKNITNLIVKGTMCFDFELCFVTLQGHSLGMSEGQCDQGFESEVIEICGRNTNCIRDGAQFLWLIKSGQHYSWQPADECADPCVRDFILGL